MDGIDLDRVLSLDPQVSVRPEPFGALLYHFGTRKLSFLKDRRLLAVVNALDGATSVREACAGAGVGEQELGRYAAALRTLADSQMVVEHDAVRTDELTA